MQDQQQHYITVPATASYPTTAGQHPVRRGITARDLLAVGFRHKRAIAITFLGIFLSALAAAVLLPKYEAEMKVLVKRERMDPLVTGQSDSVPQSARVAITAEEVNSEVELLRSRDLLRAVVLADGAHQQTGWSFMEWARGEPSEEDRIENAIKKIESRLSVEPLRKTNVISVRYAADDPNDAAKVLRHLADAYLEKHLAVNRPPGQFEFFDKQAEHYRKELEATQAKIEDFSRTTDTVAPDLERNMSLEKLKEFEAGLQQTKAAIAETTHRIRVLRQQEASTPRRLTTKVRTLDNPDLLQQLKSSLLSLELKRRELLTKYTPEYRLVREIDDQIAQTRAAIASTAKEPLRDETTDVDPAYEWSRTELAKAQAELQSLKARAASFEKSMGEYGTRSQTLNETALKQQELLRAAKTQEESYLLYSRKREEARISDALDKQRIANVALAEEPSPPRSPKNSALLYAFAGLLLATLGGVAVGFVAEYLDPSFRTPAEVHDYLELPVLAVFPAPAAAGAETVTQSSSFDLNER